MTDRPGGEPTAPPEERAVWCGEHRVREGPFTREQLRAHLGPDGPHAHLMANGAGPPWNRRKGDTG